MAEKLFDAKRLDKYAKNGYESCALANVRSRTPSLSGGRW